MAIKAEFLKDTPIPITTSKQQQILIELVDQILIAKRENPTADIIFFERKIDQIVYELYGLTEEEIRIVERVSN